MPVNPILPRCVLPLFPVLAMVSSACAGAAVRPTPAAPTPAASPASECAPGAYRSSSGDVVLLRSSATNRIHYIFRDGRRNWVISENSPIECGPGGVLVKQPGGAVETWPRLDFIETPTRYLANGIEFFGRLIEPVHTAGKPPLVVFAHGSGDAAMASGVGRPWPYSFDFLAAQGVSVFIFDKRGTGESGGTFNMNFHRLASDLAAASTEARRIAAGRFGRFGLYGVSQGGWVAPLAAKEAGADFIIVAVGAVYSPIEEDSEEVVMELRRKGYGEDILAMARHVTDATGAVRASNHETGFERLAEVKKLYGDEPWFSEINGEFTGWMLKASDAELRAYANPREIPWQHDAVAVLRSVSVPQLWMLAGEDDEAPSHLTIERLRMLQGEGKPIQMVVFPNTDHSLLEFVDRPDGTRSYTVFPEGLFRLDADWAKGCLNPPYGSANFHPPLGTTDATRSAACKGRGAPNGS